MINMFVNDIQKCVVVKRYGTWVCFNLTLRNWPKLWEAHVHTFLSSWLLSALCHYPQSTSPTPCPDLPWIPVDKEIFSPCPCLSAWRWLWVSAWVWERNNDWTRLMWCSSMNFPWNGVKLLLLLLSNTAGALYFCHLIKMIRCARPQCLTYTACHVKVTVACVFWGFCCCCFLSL